MLGSFPLSHSPAKALLNNIPLCGFDQEAILEYGILIPKRDWTCRFQNYGKVSNVFLSDSCKIKYKRVKNWSKVTQIKWKDPFPCHMYIPEVKSIPLGCCHISYHEISYFLWCVCQNPFGFIRVAHIGWINHCFYFKKLIISEVSI